MRAQDGDGDTAATSSTPAIIWKDATKCWQRVGMCDVPHLDISTVDKTVASAETELYSL